MKLSYKAPEARVIAVESAALLAGSLLNDADTQDIKIEDEVLNGDDIWIY